MLRVQRMTQVHTIDKTQSPKHLLSSKLTLPLFCNYCVCYVLINTKATLLVRMECSCGCCSALRPRYKRLVNNIYPASPAEGYDKSNLEKLTFYARAQSEKLDRIGNYLAQRIARDLSRHRPGYVAIGVEAMDRLLVTSNAQSLNLFVESFLRVVQQLVESQDLSMQLLGTQSFVKFAGIEEDTPSYHRRYDFFVSKFASMSHNSDRELDKRRQLRTAGLNGLKGVIRKTVSDDLQANIWDENHMDKIVPSLLYNMQEPSESEQLERKSQADRVIQQHISSKINPHSIAASIAETPLITPTFGDKSAPAMIAEDCLKELIRRATFGHIKSVIKPVLKHIDSHDFWKLDPESEQFSIKIFKIIMYSIQTQHSYTVIQILMDHLDDVIRSDGASKDQQIKIGIVTVLSSIVAIAAAESIGPSVLEIINSLLEHLRTSINNHGKREVLFQEAIMDTLAEFSSNLPDYQKTEILFFIKSRAPTLKPDSVIGVKLQKILQDLRGSGPETHFKLRRDSALSRSDINSISVDVESTASSPDIVKTSPEEEEVINFETFKKVLSETNETETVGEKKNRILEWFSNATFEELLEKAKSTKSHSGDYYALSLDIASKYIC